MKDDEGQLVGRCRQGDQSACREFVARFERLVFGVCLRMVGQHQDAEDLTQEVFCRALKSLHQWDGARPLRPWLLTIASNRCRSHLTQSRRRPTPSPVVDDLPQTKPGHSPEAAELFDELRAGVEQLRPEYRQVFLLYHEQGVSYDEMSVLLDKPVGTLKTWLHRARAELLDWLRNKGFVPEVNHDLSGV